MWWRLAGPFVACVALTACTRPAAVGAVISVQATRTEPASPANENHPSVQGRTSAGSRVEIRSGACDGPVLGSGVAGPEGSFVVQVEVADDRETLLWARATSSDGLATACAQEPLTYVEDSTAPVAPTLDGTSPASPAASLAPVITGSAEPGVRVELFVDPACAGSVVATVDANAGGAFGSAVEVPAGVTSSVAARAIDAAGNTSACATPITYEQRGTLPAAPTLVRVDPGPSGTDGAPRFIGTAPEGSLVTLYSDAACVVAVATGDAGSFSSTGIVVAVAEGATITVRATATDADGNGSACSSTSLTYTRVATIPVNAWRGPRARIEWISGTNEVFLTIGTERHRPVFVSVNPQAITAQEGWQVLLDEIDLASAHGMPIVDLMLGNRSVAFLDELSRRLGARQVFLWLRFDSWIPELANVGVPILKNLAGAEAEGLRPSYALSRDGVWSSIPFYSTLDERWLAVEQQSLRVLLEDISRSGIGDRVIGVRSTYLAGGEWFQPPLAFHDGKLDEDPPNQWPWSHPGAFSLGDYSSADQAAFAAWLPTVGVTNPAFPAPADRTTPRLGRTFVVGADGAGTNAALYHRFVSARVAQFQAALARTAKEATESKALVMINNGYLYSIAHYNGSLHTAFADVLASPDIDAISAPYNYSTEGTRRVGTAFVPHGPMDSPALHRKLWIHEDDTRPHWSPDGFRATSSWAEDEALLLRNAATSLIHGNALYEFDLPNQGWIGGLAAHAAEYGGFEAKVQRLAASLSGRLSHAGPVKPEVAIFIDDASYHLYPEFGLDGADSYGTSNALVLSMVERITAAGGPVRHYLLDDLARPELDVSSLKLVFFLNTPRLTQAQRALIRTRLMGGGRVLAFQHASGMFDETNRPSWTLAAEYCPGASSLGQVEASTSHAITIAEHGTYAIAHSPKGADAAAVRALVDRAGVHRWADGAIVEGQGSVLMLHTAGGAVPLRLKTPARVVDLVDGTELCASCAALELSTPGPKTRVLGLGAADANRSRGRLFRYEFVPGSVGGAITYDEQAWCSIADGEALVACGFSVQEYLDAVTVPNGQLGFTYAGECACSAAN